MVDLYVPDDPPRRNVGVAVVLGAMTFCVGIGFLAVVLTLVRRHHVASAHPQPVLVKNTEAPPPAFRPKEIPPPEPLVDVPPVQEKPAAKKPKPAVKVAAPTKTGTVRTFSADAGKTITIDGESAGIAPAPVTVACGSHMIAVGPKAPKNVVVPCGASVTVGNPD